MRDCGDYNEVVNVTTWKETVTEKILRSIVPRVNWVEHGRKKVAPLVPFLPLSSCRLSCSVSTPCKMRKHEQRLGNFTNRPLRHTNIIQLYHILSIILPVCSYLRDTERKDWVMEFPILTNNQIFIEISHSTLLLCASIEFDSCPGRKRSLAY